MRAAKDTWQAESTDYYARSDKGQLVWARGRTFGMGERKDLCARCGQGRMKGGGLGGKGGCEEGQFSADWWLSLQSVALAHTFGGSSAAHP